MLSNIYLSLINYVGGSGSGDIKFINWYVITKYLYQRKIYWLFLYFSKDVANSLIKLAQFYRCMIKKCLFKYLAIVIKIFCKLKKYFALQLKQKIKHC